MVGCSAASTSSVPSSPRACAPILAVVASRLSGEPRFAWIGLGPRPALRGRDSVDDDGGGRDGHRPPRLPSRRLRDGPRTARGVDPSAAWAGVVWRVGRHGRGRDQRTRGPGPAGLAGAAGAGRGSRPHRGGAGGLERGGRRVRGGGHPPPVHAAATARPGPGPGPGPHGAGHRPAPPGRHGPARLRHQPRVRRTAAGGARGRAGRGRADRPAGHGDATLGVLAAAGGARPRGPARGTGG